MSDDSDIWEAASSDSSDSFIPMKNKKSKANDSDSERDIKLKLKQECSDIEFVVSNQKRKIKKEVMDSCNESIANETLSPKKKKKRKYSEAMDEKHDFLENTKEVQSPKKKKKKHIVETDVNNDEEENKRYLENSCVDTTISEDQSPKKNKKKKSKKHKDNSKRDSDSEELEIKIKLDQDSVIENFEAETNLEKTMSNNTNSHSVTNKAPYTNGYRSNDDSPKKKKKKLKVDQDDFIEDKFSAEETIVQGYDKTNSETNSKRKISDAAHTNGLGTNDTVTSSESNSNNDEPSFRVKKKLNMSLPAKLSNTSRFSQGINFQDTSLHNPSTALIAAFLNERPELSRDPADCLIGEDDDVWLIRAPRIPADHFRGVTLKVEERSKVKLAGVTYTIESKPATAIALAPGGGVKPLATLVMRRKLPRILPPERSYEPPAALPPSPPSVTRHPLLGVHWEKAVRVPEAAAARLQAAADKPQGSHRKRKREVSVVEPAEEAPRRKKKRRDKEPQSWDSEKAIEQNLFNF